MDVHIASRICGAGHGGQIVVSGNTREAVMASVPDGVGFRSLGAHRLRGLRDAVALFQVVADGSAVPLPAAADALTTGPTRPQPDLGVPT